jgi:GNAT superfamily N-acetyltransferase
MAPSPSSADAIDFGSFRLEPLKPESCPRLAAAIVAIEPWSVMAYPAERLAAFLAGQNQSLSRYCVRVENAEAGVVAVRSPWLKGPYLELLALLPPAQNRGIGSRIMAWFEESALEQEARNLWVCASSFNARALRFYARHGFAPVASLPGLVADGYVEILLRKFPIGTGR